MKKILWFSVAFMALLLTSCSKESYFHTLEVQYPYRNAVVGADQPYDSVVFVTTDNFAITSNAAWLVVPDSMKQGRIPNYYRTAWVVPATLQIEPNTTGMVRHGNLSIRSYGDDDWNQTATATYSQLGWLDITHPAANYAYNEGMITTAAFELDVLAEAPADSLCFTVYGEWTLTEGSFVHPATSIGGPGTHVIRLALDANTGNAARQETITLTSRGISTSVKVKQEAKKEEQR